MLAAFNPGAPSVDQSAGPSPSHTAPGSRFNDLSSRTVPDTAAVAEAVAEWKRGTFTVQNLKELAFKMGCQVVEGKDTAALIAKIADLEKQLGEAVHRAQMAESAFASIKAEYEAAAPVRKTKAAKQQAG